ncbi:MAG: GHKL domain-containing protein [Opitutaceae bacterium]|nr:GHKL domain-containing protein [Verrucomicrobiales bacterium]
MSFSYVVAGLIDVAISSEEKVMVDNIVKSMDLATRRALDIGQIENPTEPFLLRIIVLLLMVACCYGVQVLFEKQRQAAEEAAEFNSRQEQLQAAGRLAAEIAHQIKNPLAIITNAAYSLDRAVRQGKTSVDEQINIIREEVERANRIVTELMGYAQLSEGRVERMNVIDEIELAINQVFPSGAKYEIAIRRDLDRTIPPVLMQKGHLSEILVNLLQNAREAMNGRGVIEVSTRYGENYSVLVGISDNGPGIPPDKLERIFDAYFTTKEQGTGLGLAIVKHNVELYGGSLTVESVLGQGTHFIIKLPGKSVLRITR